MTDPDSGYHVRKRSPLPNCTHGRQHHVGSDPSPDHAPSRADQRSRPSSDSVPAPASGQGFQAERLAPMLSDIPDERSVHGDNSEQEYIFYKFFHPHSVLPQFKIPVPSASAIAG